MNIDRIEESSRKVVRMLKKEEWLFDENYLKYLVVFKRVREVKQVDAVLQDVPVETLVGIGVSMERIEIVNDAGEEIYKLIKEFKKELEDDKLVLVSILLAVCDSIEGANGGETPSYIF